MPLRSRGGLGLGLRSLLVSLLVLALGAPTAMGQSLKDKEAEANRLRGEIEVLLVSLEGATQRFEAVQAKVNELSARRDELTAAIAASSDALGQQARTRYKLGTTPSMAMFLGGADDITQRVSLMAIIESRQLATLQQASGLRGSLASTETILTDRVAELASLTADLDTQQAELTKRLSSVESQVADLRARDARQKTMSRGAQNGTYACILDRGAYSYIDSWGYARSGGRSHKGTDVMAPRRAKVYAFTNGRISRMKSGGIGGTVLYLQGDDGHRYYYAHLDGFAAGISPGKRVEAGELIAYNGSTGNAQYSAPHVHFEVHPGGGGATNPYQWLRPVCP